MGVVAFAKKKCREYSILVLRSCLYLSFECDNIFVCVCLSHRTLSEKNVFVAVVTWQTFLFLRKILKRVNKKSRKRNQHAIKMRAFVIEIRSERKKSTNLTN